MARSGEADLDLIATNGWSVPSAKVCVHLHLSETDDPRCVTDTLKALAQQSHCPVKILISGDNIAAFNEFVGDGVALLPGTYKSRMEGLAAALVEAEKLGARLIVPCALGATLAPDALAAFCAHALTIDAQRIPHVIFGDTREAGRGMFGAIGRSYWLKPKWDPRMFLSQDYITTGCALAVGPSLDVLIAARGRKPENLYELVFRLSDQGTIEHIPRVVTETPAGEWCAIDAGRLETLGSDLEERATVEAGPYGTITVRWSLPTELPKVTVIVATRDRVELLRTCVEGVLNATSYPNFDLIIADNESVDPETLSYMDEVSRDSRVQVVRWPHPFNYSAINNFAATHAGGEYLCLLNNDIEVIDPEWLTEMVREAIQPGVGAVGARLLYPDRSIQHAGVAIGIGNAAGHAHRGLPEGEPGYFAQALIARGASAVTAACLLVRKDHFDAVGGLDEECLAVAYNDVDLCLKLQAEGLRNIYTPLATLIHHESKSRGLDFAPEHLERYMRELAVFQERWDTKRIVDPWHHPAFSRSSEVFATG